MSRSLKETSKFLSYVLRHEPEAINLTLDNEGWGEISALIEGARQVGKTIDRDLIQQVVDTSDKKRFTISNDGLRIRAAQGHSTSTVDIGYPEKVPPDILYHGTATRFLESILREGLRPGKRHYVHLSQDRKTAIAVGERYGKPIVLKIEALQMHHHGFKFFLAENDVWLITRVPPEYLYIT